ncbi:DNA polymerase III subunit delta' [Legionella sp. 16cNR16C]|uniref:DNA polymerase III subunit delta' n=1 Tax=Legionella sp. 16cNR16C TaxID=2905656 RepID=UPI001E4E4B9A|nr:hypothetical protein [Legionella sp. 16cNR16C]
MNLSEPAHLIRTHYQHWQHFVEMARKGKLSHSLMLVGAAHLSLEQFSLQIARSILCSSLHSDIEHCQSCTLANSKEHPDLQIIMPEKAGAGIKIEQIRDLQSSVYTSPQLGYTRVVIVYAAEKMNPFAANALLKILEEPPANVYFILLAEQVGTLLPTIISRCQLWRFTDRLESEGHLSLASCYNPESERGKLAADLPKIIEDLLKLSNNQYSACELAAKWAVYPLVELTWILYLICSEMIEAKLLKQFPGHVNSQALGQLASGFHLFSLFMVLDKINAITRNLNHNMNVNPLLALENLLIMTKQGCKNERGSSSN